MDIISILDLSAIMALNLFWEDFFMKNHQYAIAQYNLKTAQKELRAVGFLNEETDKIDNPSALLKSFLITTFLDKQSNAVKGEKIAQLMASFEENALTYLDKNAPLSKIAFYNIALQLLHFEVGLDFLIDNSIAKMKSLNLPIADVHDPMNIADVTCAWYLLLNTRTKRGSTFIDDLASQGYFAQNYDKFTHPLIFNGKTMPVYDTTQLIREVVYVESSQDTDHDGKLDLLKTEIIRPKESNKKPVPVIFTASPYNQGTNDQDGENLTHHVNVPLKHKEPHKTSLSEVTVNKTQRSLPDPRPIEGKTRKAEQTFSREQSYTLNDYFLARGYAVVYSAGIGTYESDGFRTTGDVEETISATSIIEWLTGNRTAFTNPSDNNAIEAYWSNGNVAMSGRSYLGTLQIAAATTGVEGLKTCLVEAAISNWYDYYRENGLVMAPGDFQGEDADVLAAETYSRKKSATEFLRNENNWQKHLANITEQQDRKTGNYNQFWDARNYLKDANHIKADLFIIHGLNDENVKPVNAINLWKAIQPLNINKKIILHQGQHIYINAFQSLDFTDMVNLWLAYKLMEVNNNADKLIPDILVQDNTKPQSWYQLDQFGTDELQTVSLHKVVNNENEVMDKATFNDQLPKEVFQNYCQNVAQWQHDLILSDQLNSHRLVFKLDVSEDEFVLNGQAHLNLFASSSQNFGMLSCQLIDLGEDYRLSKNPVSVDHQKINEGFLWREDNLREFKLNEYKTPFKKIAEGHINMQNRTNNYQVDDLTPDTFYDINFDLQPNVYRVKAGHQLAVVIYATDFDKSTRGNQNVQYTIDLRHSSIELPLKED
jgi:X-Pro dipeptidyl-peptidase